MLHWNSDLQCQYVRQVASWWYATHGEDCEAYKPVEVEVLQFDTRKEIRITIDDLDLQARIVVNGEILLDTTPQLH